jgi:hypothetical protein
MGDAWAAGALCFLAFLVYSPALELPAIALHGLASSALAEMGIARTEDSGASSKLGMGETKLSRACK